MKVCPICGSTYDIGVDFCFKDGAPLDEEGESPVPVHSGGFDTSGLTDDELDAPDAISLSNIPAVDYDDDSAVTQTLPTDLPVAEEFDRTTLSGFEPVQEMERDVTGIVDPFGGHEEEAFRARLADDDKVERQPTDGGIAVPVDADADVDETRVEDDAEGAPVAAAAAPEEAPTEKGAAAAAAVAPVRTAAAKPRKRTEDFAQKDDDDNKKGLFLFIGVAAIVLVGFFGFQTFRGTGEGTTQPPDTTAVRTSTPAPTPEPTAAPTPEPETPAEPGEGDEATADGDDDDATAEDGSGEPDEATEEPTEAARPEPAGDETPSAADLRARQDERRERDEQRRLQREERERRAAERAAAADAARGTPEPPFSAGEPGSTGDGAVAAVDNPWGAASTPAPRVEPTPAAGDSPWGATTPTESQVSISSQPAGARVTIGGRYRGQAPVALSLPAGTHEVRVEQQDHATQTRYVKVVAGTPVSLDVVLEPLARVAQGTVMVASSPPAMLYVDGVAKGKTPISVAIAAGAHTFRLDADGKPSFEQTMDISLADGETVNRFFQLP